MANASAHVGDGSVRWCGVLQPDAGIRGGRARSVQSEPTARVSVDRVNNPALFFPLGEIEFDCEAARERSRCDS